MSAVLQPATSPFQNGSRSGFERRDERVTDWLGEVERRQGPRRFQEVERARCDDIEQGGTGRISVSERNPDLHPVMADILQRCGL